MVALLRYLAFLVSYAIFLLVAVLIAPVLPKFAEMRDGPTNNGNSTGIEPRLPKWLAWFDTSYDNSLWGDAGWRTKHCPDAWDAYWGMVRWLWRNPAGGFCWYVISHKVAADETFSLKDSGNGLRVDKGKGLYGWYFIRSSEGAFSLRWCRKVWRFVFCFEAGWLLDVYIKSATAKTEHPRAVYQIQPQIRFLTEV
jgi:hypothetical protein